MSAVGAGHAEFLIPAEELTHGAVAFFLHQCLVGIQRLLEYAGVLVFGSFCGAVGAVSPSLGQMEKDAHPRFVIQAAVQTFRAEGIDILGEARVQEEGVQPFPGDNAGMDKQSPDAFFPVPSSAEPAAGASGLPAGCGQTGAGFGIFRGLKDPHTQIYDVAGLSAGIILEYRPSNRGDTDVQTQGIFHFEAPPIKRRHPDHKNVVGVELRGILPDRSNLMSLVVVQDVDIIPIQGNIVN